MRAPSTNSTSPLHFACMQPAGALLTTSGLRESRKRIPVIRELNETWRQNCLLGFSWLWMGRKKPQPVHQRCLAGCAGWARIHGGANVVKIGGNGSPAGHRLEIVCAVCAHVEGGKLGNGQ